MQRCPGGRAAAPAPPDGHPPLPPSSQLCCSSNRRITLPGMYAKTWQACMACLHRLQQWQCLGQEGVAGAAAAPLAAPLRRSPRAPLHPPQLFPTSHHPLEQSPRAAAALQTPRAGFEVGAPRHAWRMNGTHAPTVTPAGPQRSVPHPRKKYYFFRSTSETFSPANVGGQFLDF